MPQPSTAGRRQALIVAQLRQLLRHGPQRCSVLRRLFFHYGVSASDLAEALRTLGVIRERTRGPGRRSYSQYRLPAGRRRAC
jgi:hypothetical protein